MKKTYKIDVDCANCAAKMEEATKKTKGVKGERQFHGFEDESRI